MDSQKVILEAWEESKDQGPLGRICLMAFSLLYNIDWDTLDKKGKEEMGAFAARITDDVWEVYAKTLQVFGHDIKLRTGLFDKTSRDASH